MFLGIEQKAGYPVTVKIVEEDSSLVVHISLKATWGTFASPDLCSFYDEFGRIMKQTSIKTQIKQPILSSQKLPEGKKESSSLPPTSPPLLPPSPPPFSSLSPSLPPPPPTPSPSPATTQKTSQPPLPQVRVIWDYVNLREGPGIHYKIIGKAYRNNTFEILGENTGWLRVRLENGTEAWVNKGASSGSSEKPSSQRPPASSYDSPKTKFPKKSYDPM